MHIPEYVNKMLLRLEEKGYEAYIVGGCVRDTILGRVPEDYDITTNALPAQIKKCFEDKKTINIGEAHGTIAVISEGNTVEITTMRVDGEYEDNRHPQNVSFTRSIEEDLSRRDFTINAIAVSRGGKVVDLFGGIEDIKNKVIRAVGNPSKRFGEDALRIMRCIRFASVLGFDIDRETSNAARSLAHTLRFVSRERIFTEFSKLICGKNAGKILLEYKDILSFVIPEIKSMINFDQKNIHHAFDVYTHSVHAVENCTVDLPLRLVAFFHDIGKPDCFFMGDDGQGHFYGHAAKSAELAEDILKSLKVSNKLKSLVTELIKIHDRDVVNTSKSLRKLWNNISPEAAERIFPLKIADTLALAPEYHYRTEYLSETWEEFEKIKSATSKVSENTLALSGKELMELGIAEGKEIGKIKKLLVEAVINGETENEKGELLSFLKKIGGI